MSHRYQLHIPFRLYQDVLSHARDCAPNECCGLLAGSIIDGQGLVSHHFPLTNASESPAVEYLSDPRGMLAAEKAMRAAGLDCLAVYHSHPTSRPIPSRKDLERNAHGDSAMHLIVSLAGAEPEVACWWLLEDRFERADWKAIPAESKA